MFVLRAESGAGEANRDSRREGNPARDRASDRIRPESVPVSQHAMCHLAPQRLTTGTQCALCRFSDRAVCYPSPAQRLTSCKSRRHGFTRTHKYLVARPRPAPACVSKTRIRWCVYSVDSSLLPPRVSPFIIFTYIIL